MLPVCFCYAVSHRCCCPTHLIHYESKVLYAVAGAESPLGPDLVAMLRRVEWQLLTQVEAAYWACFRYRGHELRVGNDKVRTHVCLHSCGLKSHLPFCLSQGVDVRHCLRRAHNTPRQSFIRMISVQSGSLFSIPPAKWASCRKDRVRSFLRQTQSVSLRPWYARTYVNAHVRSIATAITPCLFSRRTARTHA